MIITAQKISKRSIFKIYFIGLTGGFFILFLLFGILAIFGADTIKLGEKSITGFMGFVTAILMWPIFSLMFTVLMWLISILGLWLYSLVRPISINLKNVISEDKPNT
jgi:hypothetical protein